MVLIIIGIALILFSSIGHITDSLVKAMGWNVISLVSRIAGVGCLFIGVISSINLF